MDLVPQLIANSIIAGSTYALIAMGFNLTYGAAKFINMFHGALAVIGAYAAFTIVELLGWPASVGIIFGILLAGFMGFLSDRLVYSSLRARKSSSLMQFVASLGLFTVFQALLAIIFTSQFQSLGSGGGQNVLHFLGADVTQLQIVIIVNSIAVFIGLAFLLKYTMYGKAIRAISDDEEVSKIMGINTDRMMGGIFFLAGALSGLAGIFIGYDIGIYPTIGFVILLEGVVASIIGGIGNVYGGFIGAFILGVAENFGIWKIDSEWKAAITFGVLILFLIFRPRGLFHK